MECPVCQREFPREKMVPFDEFYCNGEELVCWRCEECDEKADSRDASSAPQRGEE